MRTLILLGLIALAISFGTIYLIEEPGFIFIQWGDWQVELSITLAVIVLVLVGLALYFSYSIISEIARIPRNLRTRLKVRKMQKERQASVKGYMHLVQGNWDKAEKQLTLTASKSQESAMDYLAAAYSAQQRGDTKKRDELLNQANADDSVTKSVINLVKCKLLLDEGRVEEAIVSLERLRRITPNSRAIFKFLTEAYQRQNNWKGVFDLLPDLRKYTVYPKEELENLSFETYRNALRHSDSAGQLLQTWRKISKVSSTDHELAVIYVRKLLVFDRHQEAEKVIRQTLSVKWNSELAYLYGELNGNLDRKKLYDRASGWLTDQPTDPNLLLTLGRLAIQSSLWTSAGEHLSSSIENGGRYEANIELAKVLEDQGDIDGALDAYKSGVDQNSKSHESSASSS